MSQPNLDKKDDAAPDVTDAAERSNPSDGRKRLVKAALIGGATIATAVAAWLALSLQPAIPPSDDGTVIKDGVAIYDEKKSSFEILACDEESITVSSTKGLSEGTVLAVGITDATPAGALRILGAAEPVEGGYRIATSQAALTDAIEYCDVHFTATLTDNGEYEVRDETGRILAIEPAYAGEPLDNLFSKDGAWYEIQAGNEVDARIRIENGHLAFAFTDRFYAGAELDWAKEREKENVSGEKNQDEITLFDKDLKPITFSVGPVPVVITNNLSVELAASGRAAAEALSAGAVLDKTFGFEFTTGEGFDGINEDASKSPGIDIALDGPSLEFQAESEIIAAFSNMLYGVAGIQTSTGIAAEANGKLGLANVEEAAAKQDVFLLPGTEVPCKGILNAQVSIPITIDLHGELELFDKNGEEGADLEGNINLVDTEDAITLYELHLSAGKPDDAAKPEKESGPDLGAADRNDSEAAKPDGTGANGAHVELTGTYVTKWQDVNMVTYPAFTFSYPENWSIVEEDVSQGLERVALENRNGARVVFSHLPLDPGGLGKTAGRYEFRQVAESSFIPGYVQAGDYRDLGEFMVAEGICTGSMFIGEESEYQPCPDAAPFYAVLPRSWQGEKEGLRGTPDVQLAFDYGDNIAFYAPNAGTSAQDTAEIIAILSSFKAA